MKQYKEILLNAMELEHPEPLERAAQMMRMLKDGEYLHLLIRRKPTPLLQICDSQNFRYRIIKIHESRYHILITEDSGVKLEDIYVQ